MLYFDVLCCILQDFSVLQYNVFAKQVKGGEVMKKQTYITEEERKKCEKVANAFLEIYQEDDVLVVDAGRFGFVKLQNYMPNEGFDSVTTYTDSRDMFEDLWQEWLVTQLFRLSKGTPMEDLTQEELLKILPDKKQKEFAYEKICFMNRAAI